MKAIDRNIPRIKGPARVADKYPVREMEISDSFALTVEEFKADADVIRQYGQNHGKKFSIIRHDGAYRCWRIS